jgi:hypothetical protein
MLIPPNYQMKNRYFRPHQGRIDHYKTGGMQGRQPNSFRTASPVKVQAICTSLMVAETADDDRTAIQRVWWSSNIYTLFAESRWAGAELHALVTRACPCSDVEAARKSMANTDTEPNEVQRLRHHS